ncbi:FixG Ig-like domain-containing protein [Pseudomonas capeferrum]
MLYRENATGWIENVYSLKIISKSQREQVYQLSASGRQRAALRRTAGC